VRLNVKKTDCRILHAHSLDLKQSATEALVHTVVPSISLKLKIRSPHLQLLNWTTHPAIISSWASLLIYNKLLELSASEPSYHLFLSLSSHLQRSTKSFCLITQLSRTESLLTDKNLPKLSAYNTWLSSRHTSTEKLLRLSASDTILEQTKI
jgi:hypothetical protein